ncbi:MAG: Fic family protein [candidate division Zixibacteria bacterium]|nr:Fic family protein [candidate division Zixibacteria bacterium]
MDFFKLPKPEIDNLVETSARLLRRFPEAYNWIESTSQPKYLHWDKVRFKPLPDGVTPEEFWALVKTARRLSPSRVRTPVRDEKGVYFTWQKVPGFDYFLHEADLGLGGFLASVKVDDQSQRQRFIARGIMEEAIASSQLEGANTTRRVAKRMLLEQREPKNESEQMILNNYCVMRDIEEGIKNQELSEDLLLQMHAALLKSTEEAQNGGRYRKNADGIVISNSLTGMIYHIPPKEKFIRREMEKFVQFANSDLTPQQFIHPVIKAIILHFWLGFLHPFVDGNGRLARTIFYWYLLRKDYWAFSYLPVSKVIKASPVQYRDAYVYSEQDDNDLTYFIDYNLRKISQARRQFERHVRRQGAENRKMLTTIRKRFTVNDRQVQLIRFFHKNPEATTSIRTHSQIYDVSRVTARKDLEELEQLGLLSSQKIGRVKPFSATDKLTGLL